MSDQANAPAPTPVVGKLVRNIVVAFAASLGIGLGATTGILVNNARAGDVYCEAPSDRVDLTPEQSAGLRAALAQALGSVVPTVFTSAVCNAGPPAHCSIYGWQHDVDKKGCGGRRSLTVPSGWQSSSLDELKAAAAAFEAKP